MKEPEQDWPDDIEEVGDVDPPDLVMTNGKKVLLDNDDYNKVKKYTWFENSNGYPRAFIGKTRKYLHQIVMGELNGKEVDHINGNKLDNRKSNLRAVTRQQNSWNQPPRTGNYKNINPDNFTGKWQVKLLVDGKSKTICRVDNEKVAAIVADCYQVIYRGEYSRLNYPQLKDFLMETVGGGDS